MQIEVGEFVGLLGGGAVGENANQRTPRGFVAARRRSPVGFEKNRAGGARFDAPALPVKPPAGMRRAAPDGKIEQGIF